MVDRYTKAVLTVIAAALVTLVVQQVMPSATAAYLRGSIAMAGELGDRGDGVLPLDINTASREQLASYPSIGPELAERIVRHRPFSDWDAVGRALGHETLSGLRADEGVTIRDG